jgi:phage protein U
MFAKLGDHVFQGLTAPIEWSENFSRRYAKVQLLSGGDVLHAGGDDLTELSLSFVYSIDFCDPVAEIEALKTSMSNGTVLPLITGEGSLIGYFVITTIEFKKEAFTDIGQLNDVSVELKLLAVNNQSEIKERGGAFIRKAPPTQPPAAPNVSPAQSITNDVSAGKSKVAAMKATIADIRKGVKTFKRGVREVRQLAESVKQVYSTVQTKLEVTKSILRRAQDMPGSLDEAIRYAENLSRMDGVLDTEVLDMQVNELDKRADRVSETAAGVAAYAASKEGGT